MFVKYTNHFILHSLHKPHEQFGPLHDLINDLELENFIQAFISGGSLFHSEAPEYFNDSSPYFVDPTLGCKILCESRSEYFVSFDVNRSFISDGPIRFKNKGSILKRRSI